MKLFLKTIVIITSVFLVSFNKPHDKTFIQGTWKVVEFNVESTEVTPGLEYEARKIALSTVYTFTNDTLMSCKSNFYKTPESGVWSIDSNNILYFYYPGVKIESLQKECFIIDSLTDSTMYWQQDLKEMGSLYFILEKM